MIVLSLAVRTRATLLFSVEALGFRSLRLFSGDPTKGVMTGVRVRAS